MPESDSRLLVSRDATVADLRHFAPDLDDDARQTILDKLTESGDVSYAVTDMGDGTVIGGLIIGPPGSHARILRRPEAHW